MGKIVIKQQDMEEFFQRCFERFGAMNKNDYEVELMFLLLENGFEDKSDRELSIFLRIPVAKVKRLRYEADLQHPKTPEYYKAAFYKILTITAFKTDNNGNIMFAVNNKALREYLSECIEKAGSFFDSSFAGNIVKLTPTDLLLLIAEFENNRDLVNKVKESIAQHQRELPKSLSETSRKFIEATFKDVARLAAPNVAKWLWESLENTLNKIK